ncbi:hypothetical protein [Chelativorans sp. J32]|uniref:hypothetical protein n=1 Tax=Chelativorans sp. J32 TaxID=935840 RepID=UPI000482A511|nr:hypothetical protein [Chelativorans sp. J32]
MRTFPSTLEPVPAELNAIDLADSIGGYLNLIVAASGDPRSAYLYAPGLRGRASRYHLEILVTGAVHLENGVEEHISNTGTVSGEDSHTDTTGIEDAIPVESEPVD